MSQPDHFATRMLIAMQDDVETAVTATSRIQTMMAAALAERTTPTDAVEPVIGQEYAVRRSLSDMGLRLERTSGDDRRYQIVFPNRATAPDGCTSTLEELEALMPELRQLVAKLWSPAAVGLAQCVVATTRKAA